MGSVFRNEIYLWSEHFLHSPIFVSANKVVRHLSFDFRKHDPPTGIFQILSYHEFRGNEDMNLKLPNLQYWADVKFS